MIEKITRRQVLKALSAGVSMLPLMAFHGMGRGAGRAGGGSRTLEVPTPVLYVDAILKHGTPAAENEFNTFSAARTYFRTHADIIAGTHRARLTYEYSTTPYGSTQVPSLYTTGGDHWEIHCVGETGGPSTAINDSYDGDVVENQTDTFNWSVPGGATAPLGMGDITVTRNGVVLKPIRDYEFRYDTYDYANNGYPSASGSITLIEWTGSSPAAPVSNPLGAGETLTITSVEARPVLGPTTGQPVRLEMQRYNPEYTTTPALGNYAGIENLVITQTQSGNTHVGGVIFNCQNWVVKGCFLFGLYQGIEDGHPQASGAPFVRGQYEIIDTTIFDCGSPNSDLVHNAYLGRAANIILDNVVSTDVAIDSYNPGRCMKVKATDKLFVRDCVFSDRAISDWMGFTTTAGPDVFSMMCETTTAVIEDTIFHKSENMGYLMTCTSRKSPWNEAIGDHGPGPARLVYPMAGFNSSYIVPRTQAGTTGTFLDVEWHYGASAGTTQFAWQQVYDVAWDGWNPTSTSDLVVGISEGGTTEMTLIPSDGYSATNLDGAHGSGVVDLSGGASPSYPSGVPEGSIVFVSAHYKTDRSDYWTDTFWENIKICGVFASGFTSGTTSSVAWSVDAPNQGGVDDPVDADFHVSVNGATLVLDTDYTVTGGGTSSGTINFSPSLSDGDFYIITTDAHKTQGVTPVITENVHSWYYNNYVSPGSPVATWECGDGYKWPTVKRLFMRNNEFYHNLSPSTQKATISTGTRPLADYSGDAELNHPVPTGWRERHMSFAANTTRWNVPIMFGPTNTSWFHTNVVSPSYHMSYSDTYQGSAPSDLVTAGLLPEWWVTFDDVPTRIEL
jgi:hypothetical protein